MDKNSDEDTNNQSLAPEEALEREAPSEREREKHRCGRAFQPPVRLTYKNALTYDKDADLANIFVAHEAYNYDEATRGDN